MVTYPPSMHLFFPVIVHRCVAILVLVPCPAPHTPSFPGSTASDHTVSADLFGTLGPIPGTRREQGIKACLVDSCGDYNLP